MERRSDEGQDAQGREEGEGAALAPIQGAHGLPGALFDPVAVFDASIWANSGQAKALESDMAVLAGEEESSQREPEQSAEEEEDAAMGSAAALEDSQPSGPEEEAANQQEDALAMLEDATPYVASCAARVEALRKRKREQEERVEALVQGLC